MDLHFQTRINKKTAVRLGGRLDKNSSGARSRTGAAVGETLLSVGGGSIRKTCNMVA